MTTWTNFAANQGLAVTTWNYDSRGLLENKIYQDGKRIRYTYDQTNWRLETRQWERGTTATYGYNLAGDLTAVTYSDSTPSVTYTHDRLGRLKTVTRGGEVVTLSHSPNGQLARESHAGGGLDGLVLTAEFDAFRRRTNLNATLGTSLNWKTGFGFDTAGRLSSVTNGGHSFHYDYAPDEVTVSNTWFKAGGTQKMLTKRTVDKLGRLRQIVNSPASDEALSYAYALNQANQRSAITNADLSRWEYQYDPLGQVTSGKRFWSDGTYVAGQQFEYEFDDTCPVRETSIWAAGETSFREVVVTRCPSLSFSHGVNNRRLARSGGNEWGRFLRQAEYTVNAAVNQITGRTVPPYVEDLGSAVSGAVVTANDQPTYRKDAYFRKELRVDNSTNSVWVGITNAARLDQPGTNPDLVATEIGNVFVAKNPEAFVYDADGSPREIAARPSANPVPAERNRNAGPGGVRVHSLSHGEILTSDGRWAYVWDLAREIVQATACVEPRAPSLAGWHVLSGVVYLTG